MQQAPAVPAVPPRRPKVQEVLRALDPFALQVQDLRRRGTSLGGCLRLAMIPVLIAYIVVVRAHAKGCRTVLTPQ